MPLGLILPRHQHRGQDHQKSVAHIRHHDTVEQNEERRHQRVGVHIVVGGQRVHLRHHIQRLGEPVVLQLHRNLGDLILRGIRRLPGTPQLVQQSANSGELFRRRPALEKEDSSVGQQPLGVLVLGGLGRQPVCVDPQGVPGAGLGHNGGGGGLLLLAVLRDLAGQSVQILRRRTGEALEGRGAETEGTKTLQCLFLFRPMADQQTVALLLVGTDLQHLGGGVRQGRLYGGHIGGTGTHHQPEHRVLGPLDFQGHVQPTPRLQPGLPGQQAIFLSLKTGQRLELLPHLLTDLPGLFHRAAAQELFFRDGMALDEDAILQLGIPLDGRQGGVYISDLAFGDGEAGGLPLQ